MRVRVEAEEPAPTPVETICSRRHSEPSRPTARRLPGGGASWFHGRREKDPETGSPAQLTLYLNSTAVEFPGAIDNGESEAGGVLLGCEVELENLFAARCGDADTRVGDRELSVPGTKFDVQRERAALWHRIQGVDGEVHEGLPEKVGVAPERDALRPGAEVDGDGTPGGVGLHQGGDLAGNLGEVEFLLRHLDRAGEVEERTDDAVEALDFFADDSDLLCRLGRVLPDHGVKQGQASRDGVERILDLMRNSAGQSIDRIEAREQSHLRLDLPAPLRVTQADERPPVREEVQGHQQWGRAAGARPLDETLGHGAHAAAEIGRGARGVTHLRAQQAQLGLDGGELGRRRVRVEFRDGLAQTDEVDALGDAPEVARDEAGEQRDG